MSRNLRTGVYLGFEIDEGIIGKITVSGNTNTRESVILRELLLQEGDIYIEADKAESERIFTTEGLYRFREHCSTMECEFRNGGSPR